MSNFQRTAQIQRAEFDDAELADREYMPTVTLEYAVATLQDLADFLTSYATEQEAKSTAQRSAGQHEAFDRSRYALLLLDFVACTAQYHAHLLADGMSDPERRIHGERFHPSQFQPPRPLP